jgi:hypothetical protein
VVPDRALPIIVPVKTFTVHVNRPDLVDELVTAFRSGGCAARRTGPLCCAVEHGTALDEAEARVEVTFFLRAWQARYWFAHASLAP